MAPETSLTQTSVTLTSGHTPSIADHGSLEFERCSIHLNVEKGQQARTDGVLSGNEQLCRYHHVRLTPHYQAGIGTYTSSHAPGFINSITRRVSKAWDQAVAWSLPLHTQGACTSMLFVRSRWTDVDPQLDTNF